ncbi:phosphoribosyltransferase domain-containing protein [Deinococcus sp. QL22]|uniref:phosphoribosyltransferase domain-containing protein n=1 Tax=Deinococcus sp. QL22 TaxID=2939437 RepID=UPI002017611C|nr:phosphoribosyltransferase domain-containing protein [Deinococcus sp. QL22]UQN09879.1 phosphoribosyltransferase family protein [Deinococcus sp. QL22]
MTVSPELNMQEVVLPSGTLKLRLEAATAPLNDLLTYAVRRNPKRGFLFVSRVLGKHIPIAPDVAARTYRTLVAALPPLHAPHFIGLAETATALGEGVFRAWLEATPGKTGTFQHTTRYHTQAPLLLRFDEPHSHAPAHLVYDPGPAARAATELVLVDDELSTGTTLQNLATAWLELHPHVSRVVLVSLTDWCPRRRELAESLGVPVDFVSLTRGEFSFAPDLTWQPAALPAVVGNGADKTALLSAQSARYGHLTDSPTLNTLGLTVHPTDRVLVLGTGEYQYPAFALAQQIAPRVASCLWNATTRSPILPGLAILHTLTFADNVSDGISNYVYNVDPGAYSRILVGYEGACLPDPALMAALGPHAQAVRLSP